jgi:hypothetical protein
MDQRLQIEKLKRDFQAKLEKNSPRYRRAIVRELDFLYRKHGKGDLQGFLESIDKYFDIPATEKALTVEVLRQSQAEISQLWDEYFRESTDLFDTADPNTFEKLQALYKVDFSKIKSDSGAIITEEIRRSARAGQGYEVLRSRLLKRSLGESQVRTLANTALAQFDNATMIEYAQQGGVEKFKYDGVLHTNTRPFCREHLGKQYTLQQIRSMDNSQGIPVETSCGGYNCTHFWTPVVVTSKVQRRTVKPVDGLSESQTHFMNQVVQKLGIKMPMSFYKADFDKIVTLEHRNDENAYWEESRSVIHIGHARFNSEITKKMVVAHEGAHARHDTRELVTKYGPVNKVVEEKYHQHYQEIFGGKPGAELQNRFSEIERQLSSLNIMEFKQLHPDVSDSDIQELWGSTMDFFGSMTKNRVGGGHRTGYYKTTRWQMFEWFAHCSENYYVGNPYFEHYFPREYKMTIQFMKEIEDAGI